MQVRGWAAPAAEQVPSAAGEASQHSPLSQTSAEGAVHQPQTAAHQAEAHPAFQEEGGRTGAYQVEEAFQVGSSLSMSTTTSTAGVWVKFVALTEPKGGAEMVSGVSLVPEKWRTPDTP